ncbi:MAG: DUF5947 family protein [Vicinamibacterales bacterium]
MSRRPQASEAAERCELCNEAIPSEHSHLVNLESRALLCACRACYLLFTTRGAAQGRYLSVPERYLTLPAMNLDSAGWDQLDIPVGVACIFRNTAIDRMVALYPGPAGATESLLPLDAWPAIVRDNPALREVADDVEGVLLRRTATEFECHIVPIDVCYELVGRLRRTWRGFQGGDEAQHEIDEVFTRIRNRGRTSSRTAAPARNGVSR